MQLYSQTTGRLLALLLDEGILTELRTAAVGALALRLWIKRSNNPRITKIGMLGTGVQARYQLNAIRHETDCRDLVVYGRTPTKLQAYQQEMKSAGWNVTSVENPNDLLDKCDVVITTTTARSPVLTLHNPGRTRLLICIGSDAPGKTEVASNLLKCAVLRIADNATQSRERGEFQSLPDTETILDLGDYVRQDDSTVPQDGLVVFDSSGIALQDCVIAQMVYESL